MYDEIKSDILENPADWKLTPSNSPTMRFIEERYTDDDGTTIRVTADGETKELDPDDFGYAFALVISTMFYWWIAAREAYLLSVLVFDAVYSQALATNEVGIPCSEERSEVIWSVSYAQRNRDRMRARYLEATNIITARYDEHTLDNACFIYSAMYGVPLDLLTNSYC